MAVYRARFPPHKRLQCRPAARLTNRPQPLNDPHGHEFRPPRLEPSLPGWQAVAGALPLHEHRIQLRQPRPGQAAAARHFRNRLYHAHADPGPGHSTGAGRRRPACCRADRHRQDSRLYPAPIASAVAEPCPSSSAGPATLPDPDPHP
ncbi:hypothetical protein SDC9_155275 [bioreactor metagenome]|uniref:Uncharacterized protein n=1 Tax=bioreactor metagenome TaxID=1076179 RepID=A0A645F3J5_9ZZZZ